MGYDKERQKATSVSLMATKVFSLPMLTSSTLEIRYPRIDSSQVGPAMPIIPLLDIQHGIFHLHSDLPPPQPGPKVLKQPRELPVLVPLPEVHPAEVRPRGVLHRRAPAPLLRPDGRWQRPLGHGRLHEGRVHAEVLEPLGRQREGRHEGHRLEGRLEQRGGAWRCLAGVAARVVRGDLALLRPVGEVLPLEGGEVLGDVPVLGLSTVS